MGPIFFWGEDQTISNSMVKFWGSSFPYCWRWKWYPHVFLVYDTIHVWYIYLHEWLMFMVVSITNQPFPKGSMFYFSDLVATITLPNRHLKVWMVQMILSRFGIRRPIWKGANLSSFLQIWLGRWKVDEFSSHFLKWGTLNFGEHFGECPLGIFWGRQWTNVRHDFFEDLQNGMTHPIWSSVGSRRSFSLAFLKLSTHAPGVIKAIHSSFREKRCKEIRKWLKQHPKITHFCA